MKDRNVYDASGVLVGRYPLVAKPFPRRYVIRALNILYIVGVFDMRDGDYYVRGWWCLRPWRSSIPRAIGWRRALVGAWRELRPGQT